jgi:hypothetical protein
MHEWEISIQNGNCPRMNGKSPYGMGNLHSWKPRFQRALAPSGLAGMDGAVASMSMMPSDVKTGGERPRHGRLPRPPRATGCGRYYLPVINARPPAAVGCCLLSLPRGSAHWAGTRSRPRSTLHYSLYAEPRRSWRPWRPIARCYSRAIRKLQELLATTTKMRVVKFNSHSIMLMKRRSRCSVSPTDVYLITLRRYFG